METVQFAHPMDELKNRLRHILNVIPPHSRFITSIIRCMATAGIC